MVLLQYRVIIQICLSQTQTWLNYWQPLLVVRIHSELGNTCLPAPPRISLQNLDHSCCVQTRWWKRTTVLLFQRQTDIGGLFYATINPLNEQSFVQLPPQVPWFGLMIDHSCGETCDFIETCHVIALPRIPELLVPDFVSNVASATVTSCCLLVSCDCELMSRHYYVIIARSLPIDYQLPFLPPSLTRYAHLVVAAAFHCQPIRSCPLLSLLLSFQVRSKWGFNDCCYLLQPI